MSTLEWRPLDADDLPQLVALAQACLDADGGLPQLASEDLVRGLFFEGDGITGSDETGEIVAVASLSRDSSGRRSFIPRNRSPEPCGQ